MCSFGRRAPETSYVICNDELGGYQATKYLLDNGHRDILLMGGPDYISSAVDRKAGYLRALREVGAEPNPELLVEVPATASNDCGEIIHRLFNKNVRFTAIFAFSDIIAWKCWTCIQKAGLRVPEDISIVGFDYIQSRLELPFQISSVSSHKRHMSTTAVDVLISAIHSPNVQKNEQIIIDTSACTGANGSAAGGSKGIKRQNGDPVSISVDRDIFIVMNDNVIGIDNSGG